MNAAANPKPRPNPLQDLQEAIRRAQKKFTSAAEKFPAAIWTTGRKPKKEIRRESAEGRTRKTAIVLGVSGEYIGEYNAESSDGDSPGEFGRGASVPVRFYGDKMFVKRPTGRFSSPKSSQSAETAPDSRGNALLACST